MKIVYLGRYNPTEILNGPEKVAKRLFHSINKLGAECVFIEYFFDGAKYSIWKKLFGLESIYNEKGLMVKRFGLLRIVLFLIKFRPDIIHIIAFERFAVISFLVKWCIRSKYIYTVNSVFVYEASRSINKIPKGLTIKIKLCEFLLLKLSHKLIFVSEHCLVQTKKYYRIIQDKVEIINNGIDNIFYKPNRVFELSKPLKIVFYNGINSGVDRKLDFIMEVLNRFNTFEIELYNISDQHSSFASNVKFNLVNVKPMTSNRLSVFFEDKHILLKSPSFDSFSNICIEAMASGVICIVSDEVGMKFLIENNSNGFIYDYHNPKSLEDTLRIILNGRSELNKISSNARQIFQNFSWEEISAKYFSLYKRILSSKNYAKKKHV